MAKNKQQRNTGRSQQDQDFDSQDDEMMDMDSSSSSSQMRAQGRSQEGRGTQRASGSQAQQRTGAQGRGGQLQAQGGQQDILASIRPALDEARTYIEGSPVRAAAIGAVAGGLLMTLFSTEKGRAFVRMAYDYANPMVAKYAREFISQQAGNMADQALGAH